MRGGVASGGSVHAVDRDGSRDSIVPVSCRASEHGGGERLGRSRDSGGEHLRRSGDSTGDEGSASLEFIVAGLVLLVPFVYLVLTLATLQAAAFATEGAARQAARVFSDQSTPAAAQAAGEQAVDLALDDYGVARQATSVSITCGKAAVRCPERGGTVTVAVSTSVPLPLVPPVLHLAEAASIRVSASATQPVSRFAGGG